MISLGLTAVASAIHKKIFGFCFTLLIISNEEMNDIIKIVKSLEASGLLIEGIGGTMKNEAKEQKRGVLGM